MAGSLTSCYDLLTEKPKDFLTPENSFTDKSGFDVALSDIYRKIRDDFYAYKDEAATFELLGLDIDLHGPRSATETWGSHYHWDTMTADSNISSKWWERFYAYIYAANVIIDRADADVVEWMSETEKNAIVGEAKFLRAFAYRFLANMWGNVPIVIHETTSPQFNYQSAPRAEIYALCKEDLEFATRWMPDIDDQKGGRASKVAAQHLLAEILIQMGDYEGAVAQATAVIDNPVMSLMTERFGCLKDFTFTGYDYQGEQEPWGDVYWDLFREGNFNRVEGNKECIWNVQFDVLMQGGGNTGAYGGNFSLERFFGTKWWDLKDADGVSNWLKDTLSGRPIEQISVMDYAANQIWEYKGDWDRDIRNNQYNARREYYWTNPSSQFYGQPITAETMGDPSLLYYIEQPIFIKVVTALHHGQFMDVNSGQGHDNGRIYKDWYIMRLAETYLLRAEAYMNMGNMAAAAADINVIRNRAQATPVTASDVNIELVLDERARELYLEDFRLNTLMRTNKLVDHLKMYNERIVLGNLQVDDHLNKLPIPNSEIEANKEGGLIQNPGY